jgi:hypothetical protein
LKWILIALTLCAATGSFKSQLQYQEVTVLCSQQHTIGELDHAVKEKREACVKPAQRWIEQLSTSLSNPQSRRIYLQIASDDYDDNGDIEAFCRALDTVKASVHSQELTPPLLSAAYG